MIQKLEDFQLTGEETAEDLDQLLQEKLGIGFSAMIESLCLYVKERAEELARNFNSVIPYQDYGKYLEGQDKIANFFRKEATKPENWKPYSFSAKESDKQPPMFEVIFYNLAVDEGDSMTGFVYVGLNGQIRHAFVHGDP